MFNLLDDQMFIRQMLMTPHNFIFVIDLKSCLANRYFRVFPSDYIHSSVRQPHLQSYSALSDYLTVQMYLHFNLDQMQHNFFMCINSCNDQPINLTSSLVCVSNSNIVFAIATRVTRSDSGSGCNTMNQLRVTWCDSENGYEKLTTQRIDEWHSCRFPLLINKVKDLVVIRSNFQSLSAKHFVWFFLPDA